MQDTRIVAAVQHRSEHGQPWQVQLRLFGRQGLAAYVLADPVRWSQGRREMVGELAREPESLRICGCPGIRLTYSCRTDGQDLVFAETWWAHPKWSYYFVASAPAAEAGDWQRHFEAMLENMQEQEGYPYAVPLSAASHQPASQAVPQQPDPVAGQVVRYRCAVQTQLPYTLHNVTSEQRRLAVLGSPSTVAWAMVGVAAAAAYGRRKASSLEGRAVSVPAAGEAVLTDDRIALHVATGHQAGGVRLRPDSGSSSVDLEIPYRLIRRWGHEAQGVWLDIVGRGVTWLQTSADHEFVGWFARLSHGRTWQSLVPMELPPPPAIAGWNQQDPRFTFAIPPGWDHFNQDAFADYARSFAPDLLCSGVGIDAGQWEVQFLVIDCGLASTHLPQADSESLAALLIEGLEPPGAISLVTLDNDPAVLARAAKPTAEGVFDRTYGSVVHGGVLFAFWYGVVGGTHGDGSHERWLRDFHNILATWHWY